MDTSQLATVRGISGSRGVPILLLCVLASCPTMDLSASQTLFADAEAAARERGAKAYVQDGLIFQLDGIENVAYGQPHDDSATTWKDLTGNRDDVVFSGTGTRQWNAQSFYLNAKWGLAKATFDGTLPESHTIEVCFKVANASSSAQVLGGTGMPTVILTSPEFMKPYLTGYGYGGDGFSYFFFSPTKGATYSISQSGDVADGAAVYISGGCCSSNIAISTTSKGANPVCIGNRADWNAGFEGDFYSIRFYDRALKPEEVLWNSVVDSRRFTMLDAGCVVAGNQIDVKSSAYSSAVTAYGAGRSDSASSGIGFSSFPPGSILTFR